MHLDLGLPNKQPHLPQTICIESQDSLNSITYPRYCIRPKVLWSGMLLSDSRLSAKQSIWTASSAKSRQGSEGRLCYWLLLLWWFNKLEEEDARSVNPEVRSFSIIACIESKLSVRAGVVVLPQRFTPIGYDMDWFAFWGPRKSVINSRLLRFRFINSTVRSRASLHMYSRWTRINPSLLNVKHPKNPLSSQQ